MRRGAENFGSRLNCPDRVLQCEMLSATFHSMARGAGAGLGLAALVAATFPRLDLTAEGSTHVDDRPWGGGEDSVGKAFLIRRRSPFAPWSSGKSGLYRCDDVREARRQALAVALGEGFPFWRALLAPLYFDA